MNIKKHILVLLLAAITAVVMLFYCTNPVRPDFDDPPAIGHGGKIQYSGALLNKS